MSKLNKVIFCFLLAFSMVNSLKYHVKLDVGDGFKEVYGTMNILVIKGFQHTQHKLKTTLIKPGILYVYPTDIDIEIDQITQVTFLWNATFSKNSSMVLNQLVLMPSYIPDNEQRSRAKLNLCPVNNRITSNVQAPLHDCKLDY